MESRGQTALEYLITYGWAILVILIVLSVLWYYGIFNPATWAGSQVISSTSFQVLDWKISNTSLDFSVGNKAGSTVELTALAVSGDIIGSWSGTSTVLANGNANLAVISWTTPPAQGATVSFDVTVTYDNKGVGGMAGKTEVIQFKNVKVP
jgi:hypothetical protein